MTDRDDVDLEAKLAEWESFYNFARPNGAFGGGSQRPEEGGGFESPRPFHLTRTWP